MKIAIVSNQVFSDGRVTNPVLTRMKNSMQRDNRVSEVMLLPVIYSFRGLTSVRSAAKLCDIIHIHFGGLYAMAVWIFLIGVKRPKLITFHGTDIHAKTTKTEKRSLVKFKIKLNQYASFFSILLYNRVGFVAQAMLQYVPKLLMNRLRKKAFIQPLGVDYQAFKLMDKELSKSLLKLDHKKYVLFSTISNSSIKRQDIAEEIVRELGKEYELLVMCGVNPEIVPVFINSSDLLLLTSDEEGSPNIIRECLALNKPVFSVNVGDAAQQLDGLTNSRIINRIPSIAAKEITDTINKTYTDNTREALRYRLDFDRLNGSIIDLYEGMLK